MANHYKTLRVKKKATQQEIKDSYRDLAREYHPDKQGGDEKKFKELSNAYEVLGDGKRRKLYDATGSDVTEAEVLRKAGGLLQQMFQLVVSQKGLVKIQETDVIKDMTEQLALGMSQLDKNIEVARNSRKEIGKVLKRVKHPNKMNLISVMLKHEIQKHTETVTKSRHEKAVGKLAGKPLKEYGFDFDQAEFKVNRRMGYGMNITPGNVVYTGVA